MEHATRTTMVPAAPGERCSCGRPATVVYITADHGRVPWCGQPDEAEVTP